MVVGWACVLTNTGGAARTPPVVLHITILRYIYRYRYRIAKYWAAICDKKRYPTLNMRQKCRRRKGVLDRLHGYTAELEGQVQSARDFEIEAQLARVC